MTDRRPRLSRPDRVRVELRLPRACAESAYRCAREWDVSLSEAGARLIDMAVAQLHHMSKSPVSQHECDPSD